MDLKANLRQAISWYGLEVVYNGLHEICKEDYEFLKKLYDVPGKVKAPPPAPAPAQEPSPAPQEVKEEEIPRPEKLKDAKVRVVKKPTSPEDLANIPLTQTTYTPPVTQSVTSALVQGEHTQHTSGLTDPKDIKKWQKEQEDKKKRELDAQGINPASLLTKENLQKWIVEEKKTFAAVARDYVGLPDSMVSSAAKSYGIQSETSKRRAIIAASKRK